MKKVFVIFFSFFFFVFSATVALSCDWQGCEGFAADGYVKGDQSQHQGLNHPDVSDKGENAFKTGSRQTQKEWAEGEGSVGFSGSVDMGQGQYQPYNKSIDLPNGGFANHWGKSEQEGSSNAAIDENCRFLNIDSGQEQTASTFTNQEAVPGGGFKMDGRQHVAAEANINISGAKGTVSAYKKQEQEQGYYNESPNGKSWQGGSVKMETRISNGEIRAED